MADYYDPIDDWHQVNQAIRCPPIITQHTRLLATQLTNLLRNANPQRYNKWKVTVSGCTRFGIADLDSFPVGRRGLVPRWVRDPLRSANDKVHAEYRQFEGKTLRVELTLRPDYQAIFSSPETACDSLHPVPLSTLRDDLEFTAKREAVLSQDLVLPKIDPMTATENGGEGLSELPPAGKQFAELAGPSSRPYILLPTSFINVLEPSLLQYDQEWENDKEEEEDTRFRTIAMLGNEGPDTMLEDIFDRYLRIAPPLLPFLSGLFAWAQAHGFRWAPEYREWTMLAEPVYDGTLVAVTSKQAQELATRCLSPSALFLMALYYLVEECHYLPSIEALIPRTATAMETQRFFNTVTAAAGTVVEGAGAEYSAALSPVDLSLLGNATRWFFDGCLTTLSRGEQSVLKLFTKASTWYANCIVPLYVSSTIVEGGDGDDESEGQRVVVDPRLTNEFDTPVITTDNFETSNDNKKKKKAANQKHRQVHVSLRQQLCRCAAETVQQYHATADSVSTTKKKEEDDGEAVMLELINSLLTTRSAIVNAHVSKNCSRCNGPVEQRPASSSATLLCKACSAREAKESQQEGEADTLVVANLDGICIGCHREVSYLKGKLMEVMCNSCRF